MSVLFVSNVKFWKLIKCSKEFAPHYEILFGVAESGGARGQRHQPVTDGGRKKFVNMLSKV